jgi:predicted kinase
MVRECHGKLRLSKLVLLDAELVPIDCASGEAERWCDPMSDIAVLVMELFERGNPDLALTFLNAYLEESGDYAGLAVLRFYVVERALERAHCHLVHARRSEHGSAREWRQLRHFNHSVALAKALTQSGVCGVVLMHGVTDGARTEMATAIADALQAITLRYDVELSRIRQAGVAAHPGAPASLSPSNKAYEALGRSLLDVLHAGYLAVIDAPCLLRSERTLLVHGAGTAGAPIVVVTTHPSGKLLRAAWMAEFALPDSSSGQERLLTLQRELGRIEDIVGPEKLAVVDLDVRGLTPKALERVREALDVRGGEQPTQSGFAQVNREIKLPEPESV